MTDPITTHVFLQTKADTVSEHLEKLHQERDRQQALMTELDTQIDQVDLEHRRTRAALKAYENEGGLKTDVREVRDIRSELPSLADHY